MTVLTGRKQEAAETVLIPARWLAKLRPHPLTRQGKTISPTRDIELQMSAESISGVSILLDPAGELIPGETILELYYCKRLKLYYCKRLNGYVTIPGFMGKKTRQRG
jgi:hypothetical protein